MIAPAPRRDLDFAPLTRGVGLGVRLRAVTANNVLVIGATVAVLVLLVPLVALVAMVAAGNADEPVGVPLLVFVAALGAYAVHDVLWQAGGASALADFARANGLESMSGTIRRDYDGSLFADGSHLVQQAVRTPDAAFVEVGDRFPTTPPPTTDDENAPELYLRARLAGRTARNADLGGLVTPELSEQLTRFAGPYAVEVSRHEVTVFGSRRLGVEADRVEEAFALVAALAARADAVLVTPRSRRRADGPGRTPSGIPIPAAMSAPADSSRGRTMSALAVVCLTLTLLIVLPLGLVVAVATLDGEDAVIAVPLFLIAAVALVGLLVRTSTTRGADR